MADLPDALLDRFRALSLERVDRIESAWAALTSRVGDEATDGALLHEIHTLKGEARVLGFNEVALITERLEELTLAVRRRGYRINEEVDVVVTMGLQFVRMLVRRRGSGRSGIDLEGFLSHLDEVLVEWPRHSNSPAAGGGRTTPAEVGKLAIPARQRLGTAATDVFLEYALAPSSARLERAWRTLSTELAELDSVAVRPLVDRHIAAARDLARDLGKAVELSGEAADVSVGVEVLDAMNTVILHVLRNAMDHGLEAPEVRVERGKPRAGRVRLAVASSSEGVELTIEDDGAGVDVDRVRRRAEAQGLLSRDEAAGASLERLLDIITAPGFTSRDAATPISGRGIGLDAVRAAAERVHGRVRLASTPGEGMTVRATFPSAAKLIEVHRFPSTRPGLTLAVATTWRVRDGVTGAHAANPLRHLDVPCEDGDLRATFARDQEEHTFFVGGAPRRALATRVCPTPPQALAEVVLVDGRETLLLRPEALPTSPEAELSAG